MTVLDTTGVVPPPRSVTTSRFAVIGAGRIGAHHAEAIARHVPGAELVTVVDPDAAAAVRLGESLGVPTGSDPAAPLHDPDVDGVVVCAPARRHAELVVAALEAGKHVFVEKPMAVTLADADRVIAAAEAAGRVVQVGFNRRFAPGFAAAHRAIEAGRIGTPQLLRSLTRDPGPFTADATRIPQWTIFLETLIHDFDTLCWLNVGARPVRVFAAADALVAPEAKTGGHLDTAVVTITFDNGAIATAEASFSALYGYDVRGEVFGSAGMVTAGDGRTTDMVLHVADGRHVDTSRGDTELLHEAYVAEFAAFTAAVRDGRPAAVGARDARAALTIALGAVRSVETGGAVDLDTLEEGR